MAASQFNGPQHRTKINRIVRFGGFSDKNRVNSSNYYDTIFKYFEKFNHPFSHMFIFGNMFPESHGFVSIQVTRSNNFVYIH